MDIKDFLRGLKTEHEKFAEDVAAAEHLIRLKKQAGLKKKEAVIEKCAGCGMAKEACLCPGKSKMAEGMPGWVRPVASHFAMGALPGAVAGYTTAPSGQGFSGAVTGAMMGGVATAGGGHLMRRAARYNKALASKGHSVEGLLKMPMKDRVKVHKQVSELAKKEPLYPLEKDAAVARLRRALRKQAGIDPAMLTTMGIGGALGGGLAYLSSRPQENLGGKSWDEDTLERAVAGNRSRPEPGLARKMLNRTTELGHGLAKAFREHPVKATAIGGGVGAGVGYGLGKAIGLSMTR